VSRLSVTGYREVGFIGKHEYRRSRENVKIDYRLAREACAHFNPWAYPDDNLSL
jgi:hypothetical protein